MELFASFDEQIHIRYEDRLPDSPYFAFGMIIDSLLFNVRMVREYSLDFNRFSSRCY